MRTSPPPRAPAAEAAAVLDAMRLRGLAGAVAFLRHPILGMERFTVR
jgi:energy-coupling factor transport system permease protein